MIFWGDGSDLPTFAKIFSKLNLKMVGCQYLGDIYCNPIMSLISRFIQDIVCRLL